MILTNVYFFDVAVQGYDENFRNIDLEELQEGVDKDFSNYNVIITKQSYPDEAINVEFMSNNINISGFIFELQTIIGTRSLIEKIWD